MFLYILGGIVFLLGWGFFALSFRVVVPTNAVHILQSTRKTTSYGKDQPSGNVYYRWPSWIPVIGVRAMTLPVSVFDVNLDGYAAYDIGRVPFVIDIMAFFRIEDSNVAAQRVANFGELESQLKGILQGVCRTILATSEIEEILQGRSSFGEKFTTEVDHNLKNWGVQSVKQIELMDIRDASQSAVIANIMAKKKSQIEKESRVAVASNQRDAQSAEILANQEVALRDQEAKQTIGKRNAVREQEVGIATQLAQQAVKLQEKETAAREMDVNQVRTVRAAEIARDAAIVNAQREKQVLIVQSEAEQQKAIIEAEGTKQQTILIADGHLEQQKRNATGIELEGKANGAAETAVLMAPVTTQTALAREIGANPGYQTYLVSIRNLEKDQAVGIAQAEALKAANIKVIANTGQVVAGVQSVMDLFSSKGGTAVGAALEAFAQTPTGSALLKKLNGEEEKRDEA